MTARRIVVASITIPAAFGALIGYGFGVAWQRIGREMPGIVLWLDENYPPTETP